MPSSYILPEIKRLVIDRAQGRCEYCQCRADYTTETFPIEHIIPVSRGGTSQPDNLALACSSCNGHKYNKVKAIDPANNEMVPLYNPRLQIWKDHFGWRKGYTQIIGLTPTGRATVELLQMNHIGLLQMNHIGSVNLREVLYQIGKHPPKMGSV